MQAGPPRRGPVGACPGPRAALGLAVGAAPGRAAVGGVLGAASTSQACVSAPRCLRNMCKFLILLAPLFLLLGKSALTWRWPGTCTAAHGRASREAPMGGRVRGCPLSRGRFPLLQGAGLSSWGQGGFLSLLPALNWTRTLGAPGADEPQGVFSTGAAPLPPPPEVTARRLSASCRPAPEGPSSCRWEQGRSVGRPSDSSFRCPSPRVRRPSADSAVSK